MYKEQKLYIVFVGSNTPAAVFIYYYFFFITSQVFISVFVFFYNITHKQTVIKIMYAFYEYL